jgi:hypothetical protein
LPGTDSQNQDEVVLYDFVEEDDVGDEYLSDRHAVLRRPREVTAPSPVTPPLHDDETPNGARLARPQRDSSVVVIHKKGELKKAADGYVKVNMAKFILFRLTDERIEELKREKVKTDVELKAGDFWECRLFASTGSTKHPRFVKVGDNTANLMRHCKTHHEHVLTGIERLIAELPRGEAEVTIPEFIAKQRAPIGSLARLWGRQADSQ